MITLKEWMELVDYKITEGSDFFNNVPDLYCLTSWNGEQDGWSCEIVFAPKEDQRVYCVEVCDYKRNRAYRVIDSALNADSQAWDDTKWTDLEADEDFLEKAQAIINEEDYDTRVQVPVNLPDDILFDLMKMAHDRDITLNNLVETIIKEEMDRLEEIKK